MKTEFNVGSYCKKNFWQLKLIPSIEIFYYKYEDEDGIGEVCGESNLCFIFDWLCFYFEIRITSYA
jgi:hypothetical protein